MGADTVLYNYFRDYEPSTGRYIESDPIGLRGGLNTYGYGLQNSLRYTDRTGEATEAALGLCIAGGPANPFCDAAVVINVCKWVGIGIGAMLMTGDSKKCEGSDNDAANDSCYEEDEESDTDDPCEEWADGLIAWRMTILVEQAQNRGADHSLTIALYRKDRATFCINCPHLCNEVPPL